MQLSDSEKDSHIGGLFLVVGVGDNEIFSNA